MFDEYRYDDFIVQKQCLSPKNWCPIKCFNGINRYLKMKSIVIVIGLLLFICLSAEFVCRI